MNAGPDYDYMILLTTKVPSRPNVTHYRTPTGSHAKADVDMHAAPMTGRARDRL